MTRNEGRHQDDEARGKNGTHETGGLFEKERRDCVVKTKEEAEANGFHGFVGRGLVASTRCHNQVGSRTEKIRKLSCSH